MFEDIDKNIYSSPRDIYFERLDKDLRQFLEDKAMLISRAGKDILIELDPEKARIVLSELKDNPELSIDVLKNFGVIKNGGKSYLLSELMVADYGHSIILKTEFTSERSFKDVVDVFREFYGTAENFYPAKAAGEEVYNLNIPGMMLYGCDGFDIDLSVEDDIINTAYIDKRPLKVLSRDFYKDLEIEQLVSYMGRFDCNAGIFGELAFCRGIEELLQLEVPRRAEYLRILVSELFRVTSHLGFLAGLTEILGYDYACNLIMIERENLLGIIEVVTGARVIPNFIRIGGVSSRVGSDIVKRIKRTMAGFVRSFSGIEKMLKRDFALVDRLSGLGIISRETASRSGLSGPNLRASGPRYDLRKDPGHSIYGNIHFTVPYARGGSCLDRVMVRIGEVYQSVRIIKQVAERIPAGPVIKRINLSHLDFNLTPFTSSVECPHGVFKIFGEVEGNSLKSFAVLGPSGPALSIVGSLLEGNSFDDIEVIIASMDISSGELIEYM
jgi:NADH-quinone oxidoreductase subunit D